MVESRNPEKRMFSLYFLDVPSIPNQPQATLKPQHSSAELRRTPPHHQLVAFPVRIHQKQPAQPQFGSRGMDSTPPFA
jgi:hypothetical protein